MPSTSHARVLLIFRYVSDSKIMSVTGFKGMMNWESNARSIMLREKQDWHFTQNVCMNDHATVCSSTYFSFWEMSFEVTRLIASSRKNCTRTPSPNWAGDSIRLLSLSYTALRSKSSGRGSASVDPSWCIATICPSLERRGAQLSPFDGADWYQILCLWCARGCAYINWQVWYERSKNK